VFSAHTDEPERRTVMDPRYRTPPISRNAVPRVKVVLSATVRVTESLTSLILPAAPALTTHVPAENAPPPPLKFASEPSRSDPFPATSRTLIAAERFTWVVPL
jgi:hypothetical protein